jgi:hypothetical protein
MPESFTTHWPYLFLAIALLWFPRQWLRTGKSILKKRHKPDGALERLAGMGARDPEDRSVQPAREFANFRNYVDLFRGLAGGHCLTHYAFTVSGEAAIQQSFWLNAVIILIAVLIQTVRFRGRMSFYAAIFFLVGLNVGSSGHYFALFAFAIVLAINPIIANPRIFLTVYGLLQLPFGFAFDADLPLLALNSILVLLIPLLSLLSKRPVVIFSRKPKKAAAG